MIGVSAERDPEVIKLLRQAGLDPDTHREVLIDDLYMHVRSNDRKKYIIERSTGQIVESPGALAGDPGHK